MHLDSIIADLPQDEARLKLIQETLFANAIMIAEVAAPTFQEADRIEFIAGRLRDSGLESTHIDAEGNVCAILPGQRAKTAENKAILVCAHADENKPDNSVIQIKADSILGAGMADNALGLATMVLLPDILRMLDIRLSCDLILLGAVSSLGAGDLTGFRYFLENNTIDIKAGICLEGVHLGRLSYSCIGMVRGEILCSTKVGEGDWVRISDHSAITTVNQILNRIQCIPIPKKPKTSVVLGSLRAGRGFNQPPTNARLRFEIRSEEVGMSQSIRKQIEEIIDEVDAETGSQTLLRLLAHRRPGGIGFNHPLTRAVRRILEACGVEPKFAPSVGGLSALIFKGIPSVTVGLTRGSHVNEREEIVEIDPIYTGINQLTALLRFIDANEMPPVDSRSELEEEEEGAL